jgi:hypothetical protein
MASSQYGASAARAAAPANKSAASPKTETIRFTCFSNPIFISISFPEIVTAS